jgi:aryl-alcohol dehydrogenase-like predicted oxidoreductase
VRAMEQRVLGKTGFRVSVLGFGGSEIGEERLRASKAGRLLNAALDAGLSIIDTAECYGASEELIGATVAHRRRDYCLVTKCGHASGLSLPEWTPSLIERSIERSLKRLRTDCIDVVQLHSCSEEILRKGDVVAALQRARDKGNTRYIGYSGDNGAALYAVECGAFDTLQISVSIADQEAIDTILPAAVRNRIGVIAKRPIANAAWVPRWPFVGSYSRTYRRRLRKLAYDFLTRDARQAIGIALRFALSVPGVNTAIVGTSNPSRYESNAALAAQGPLPPTVYETIRKRWRAVAEADWTGRA